MSSSELTQAVRQEALRLGFAACGFAPAGPVSGVCMETLDRWVANRYHADMGYMERNRHLREDPTQLVPGCRTLIVVALNYYPKRTLPKEGYQIAYYAYGKDYHRVVKDKLHQLLGYIKTLAPDVEGRAFCDTAPLPERYWAVRAGLGFMGRNRTLIIPGKGSYFFLGVLAVTAELGMRHEADSSSPTRDTSGIDTLKDDPVACGDCKRCLLACPTGALTREGIDCRRCLSYLTIEHRGPLPEGVAQKLGRRIFGCDTCQQVCPHNKLAQPTEEEAFDMAPEVAALTPQEWMEMTPERYRQLFKHSAMERAGYEGLMRNLQR